MISPTVSFGVKPEGALEPLSEETISDPVISEPDSPGRIESLFIIN